MLRRAAIGLSVAISGAVALYTAFPPYDYAFVAWFALAPLLVLLRTVKPARAFFAALMTGLLWWGLHIFWLNSLRGFPVVSFMAIIFYCAVFFGCFGFCFAMVSRHAGWPSAVVAPPLWVAFEYLRYNLDGLSLPWGLLGQSQHSVLPVIQIASFTSIYGVSFLVTLVNGALADMMQWVLDRRAARGSERAAVRPPVFCVSAALVITVLAAGWGAWQVKNLGEGIQEGFRASLIQGNIPQGEKWDPAFNEKILQRYQELSHSASEGSPDLIIWPESSTPGYLRHDPVSFHAVKEVAVNARVPVLLGSGSPAKTTRDGRKAYRNINSAFLLDSSGKIVSSYDKIVLVPFWEYLPFEKSIPWPRWLVPTHGTDVAGGSRRLFAFSRGPFGVVICWENLFPDFFRRFVKDGARFMVNLTNEAMFAGTPASYHVLSMAVFRAVENRVSLLRCANTGITCLIDPLGRVRTKVTDVDGKDLMVTGAVTVSVPEPMGPTFYTRHGDLFALACSAASMALVLMSLCPSRLFQPSMAQRG